MIKCNHKHVVPVYMRNSKLQSLLFYGLKPLGILLNEKIYAANERLN